VARFSFHALTIPLIFSTIASSVTVDSMGDYWFVLIGSIGVLGISFVTTTLLARIPCLTISNNSDFSALRIAATFPNIVALPILIFPSLCEYEVVYQAFGGNGSGSSSSNNDIESDTATDQAELYRQCTAQSNTMIFCYFFGWSIMFWSFGHRSLMNAARTKQREGEQVDETAAEDVSSIIIIMNGGNTTTDDNTTSQQSQANNSNNNNYSTNDSILFHIKRVLWQTFSSPPFVAMILAFVVGCIEPVCDMLFSPGGALRFLGAALQTLGEASSPLSTMVVAASLVSAGDITISTMDEHEEVAPSSAAAAAAAVEGRANVEPENEEVSTDSINEENMPASNNSSNYEPSQPQDKESDCASRPATSTVAEEESPVMSDPNFGPLQLRRRSTVQRFSSSLRKKSIRVLEKARRTPPEQRRLFVWFTLSRLILSPALVVLAVVGLDCSGVLTSSGVPALSKLVLIVNAAVPGALIVVVLLKSNPDLHGTAAVVAKVYLPTYILSIVTIAAWTAVGLLVSIPDEDGNSFCASW